MAPWVLIKKKKESHRTDPMAHDVNIMSLFGKHQGLFNCSINNSCRIKL